MGPKGCEAELPGETFAERSLSMKGSRVLSYFSKSPFFDARAGTDMAAGITPTADYGTIRVVCVLIIVGVLCGTISQHLRYCRAIMRTRESVRAAADS